MTYYTTVVGLDVHKESIVAAVLPYGRSEVTEKLSIENNPKAIEKLVNRITRQGRRGSYTRRGLAVTRYTGRSQALAINAR